MEQQDRRPVFGRPQDWDKMTPEQKQQWALQMLRAAVGDDQVDESDSSSSGPKIS